MNVLWGALEERAYLRDARIRNADEQPGAELFDGLRDRRLDLFRLPHI